MSEPTAREIRSAYRGLLLRGLDPGEAANVTAYLCGLPSAGIRWKVAEVEAIVARRVEHELLEELSLDDLVPVEPLIWQSS